MLTRKPQKGDLIRWPEWPADKAATVVKTPEGDDTICWTMDRDGRSSCFIWRHPEGLNTQAEIVQGQYCYECRTWTQTPFTLDTDWQEVCDTCYPAWREAEDEAEGERQDQRRAENWY